MKKYLLNIKERNKIEKHYEKFFTMAGAVKSEIVFHDEIDDDMHIDIVLYKQTEAFPFNVIATVGMSAYRMNDAPYKNIELISILPKDWKIDSESLKDIQWYWPIELMISTARLPYLSNSILSVGHTISMDSNNIQFAPTTEMCGGFITFPTCFDYGVFSLNVGGFFSPKIVNFLCLTAINQNELELIKEKGYQYFIEHYLVNPDGSDDLLIRNKR